MRRINAGSVAVAVGIFLSRIAGFVRERLFAHYFGNSPAAGAFRAALRIPNLLQNLFGEGALSASFIPVYSRLLAEGREEDAGRVAGTVLSLLFVVVATLVALGVTFSGPLTDLLAPGFEGPTRDLTVQLVQIIFPGTGLLALSAWCLGILNSHRRFFLSYVAPVIWNVAIMAALVAYGPLAATDSGEAIARVAWGTVLGGALQFLVQVPSTLRLLRSLRLSLRTAFEPVRVVIGNFVPAVLARGVVQLSAYLDQVLSSFLGAMAVAAIGYAQTIATLPVSLFGIAISAAELPEMSSALGTSEEVAAKVRARLENGLRRIAYFVVPSAVAFVVLGDFIVSTIFQTGRFVAEDTRVVWLILAGSAVGLLPTTQGRLCASAFWALRDTRRPALIAVLRVTLSGTFGYLATFPLRARYGWEPPLAAAALTGFSSFAGWVELAVLRRTLSTRIGGFRLGAAVIFPCLFAAALASGGARYAWHLASPALPPLPPALVGAFVLGLFGAGYLALTLAAGLPEARDLARRLRLRRAP